MCYSQDLNYTGKEGPNSTMQEYQCHVSAACNSAGMTLWMVKKQLYKAQCSKTAIKVKLPYVKVTPNVIREIGLDSWKDKLFPLLSCIRGSMHHSDKQGLSAKLPRFKSQFSTSYVTISKLPNLSVPYLHCL